MLPWWWSGKAYHRIRKKQKQRKDQKEHEALREVRAASYISLTVWPGRGWLAVWCME